MAERIIRQLIDDIDNSEIADGGGDRISFSVRGTEYQIDLSNANIAKFDKALKPFVQAAVKVRGAKVRSPKAKGRGNSVPPKERLAAIREWARNNGYDVAERGRVKAEVVEAFEAAN